MKVAIVGSRDWNAPERVIAYVNSLPSDTIVISGGARGVDTWAANAARLRGLEVVEFLPDWKRYGKAAGMIRNSTIVEKCDKLVAFWNGSRGTLNSITKAKSYNKPVEVFEYD